MCCPCVVVTLSSHANPNYLSLQNLSQGELPRKIELACLAWVSHSPGELYVAARGLLWEGKVKVSEAAASRLSLIHI